MLSCKNFSSFCIISKNKDLIFQITCSKHRKLKWCKLFKHYKTILHILEPIIVSGFFVPKLCQPRALKPLAIKVFSSKNGPFLALFSIFVCSLRLRVKKIPGALVQICATLNDFVHQFGW